MKRKQDSTKTIDNRWQEILDAQLNVQGIVLRSFSHEMNNHTAIINESCGLLDDYRAMGALGDQQVLEKLPEILETIEKRSSTLARMATHLNRFAHRLTATTLELNSFIEEQVFLLGRFAALKKITVEAKRYPRPLTLELNHCHLHPLFYSLFQICLGFLHENERIRISPQPEDKHTVITLAPSSPLPPEALRELNDLPDDVKFCMKEMAAETDLCLSKKGGKVTSIKIILPPPSS